MTAPKNARKLTTEDEDFGMITELDPIEVQGSVSRANAIELEPIDIVGSRSADVEPFDGGVRMPDGGESARRVRRDDGVSTMLPEWVPSWATEVIGQPVRGMGGSTEYEVPEWAALSAYAAIALGTLWGGWKIIETMGLKITTLHANSGAAANIGASTAIFGATALGAPISTTQAAASSVVGAGVSSGKGANWKVVGEMMLAWIFTIPFAAIIAFLMFWLTQLPSMLAWVAVGAVVIAFTIWVIWAMRHTIHADDVEAEIPGEEELAEFLLQKEVAAREAAQAGALK